MAITKIAQVDVGAGGVTSIDFTSIPQTFTDLILMFSLRGSNADVRQEFSMFLNNNGSGYSFRSFLGSGSSASSTNSAATAPPDGTAATATAGTFSNGQVYFPNYAGSTNKSYSLDQVTENNGTSSYQILTMGLWSNTAAINQISVQGTTIQQYSSCSLYGISKLGATGATVA